MLKIILEIIKLFIGSKKIEPAPMPVVTPKEPPKPEKELVEAKKSKAFITLDDWITSSGRYPERAKSPELTEEIKTEAQKTLDAVNALLNEIGWTDAVSISSGFRPSGANAAAGGAKRSAHMTGLALDIFQPKVRNLLGEKIRELQNEQGRSGILGQYGLMMEALEFTVGKNSNWVHLDRVKRGARPSMEFRP